MSIEAMKAARDTLINLRRMAKQHPALQGREYIDLGIETNNTIDKLDAAIQSAPPEYLSTADDEATRWRHGEPVAQPVSDEPPGSVLTNMAYAYETALNRSKPSSHMYQNAMREAYKIAARSVRAAQPDRVSVPEGWVSVPREPTDEMIFAAGEAWENSNGGLARAWRDVYVGMLDAAQEGK